MKKSLGILVIGFIPSITILLVCHNYGLGVSADSTHYLEITNNIADFNGIVDGNGDVVTHWPPLYPIVIASIILISGMPALSAALILNSLLSFIMAVSLFSTLRKLKYGKLESISISTLFFISLPFTVFLWAWSEPLFLVLLNLTLWCSIHYNSSDNLKHLFLLGVLSGLLILTRYAGLGLVFGFILYETFSRASWRKKIKGLIVLTGSIMLTIVPWVLFLLENSNSSPVRKFVIHPINSEKFFEFFETLRSWFVPYSRFWVIVFIILSTLLIYLAITKKIWFSKRTIKNSNFIILISVAFSYLVFLVISISFFDFHTPLDNRILGPIYLIFVLILAIHLPIRFINRSKLEISGAIVLAILLISATSKDTWIGHANYGGGFTHKIWKESETLFASSDVKCEYIFSNGYDIIDFYISRDMRSKSIPIITHAGSGKRNDGFEEQLSAMKNLVDSGEAIVTYFDNVSWRWYLIKKEELISYFSDNEIKYFNDGFIIFSANNRCIN